MASKARIGFVAHEGLAFGGSSTSLLNLLDSVDRDRFEPFVICPRGSYLAGPVREAGAPVRFIDYHDFELRNPARFLQTMGQLATAIVSDRLDIVHLNHHSLVEHVVRAARLCRRPVVIHFRGIEGADFISRRRQWYSRSDRIIAVSRAVAENLLRHEIEADKLTVIHGGVKEAFGRAERTDGYRRLRLELNLPEQTRLVGIVGEVMPEKGQADFVRAARLLLATGVDVRFVVVGTDFLARGHLARVKALARELGLSGALSFLGFRHDIASILAALDVSVLASWQEALGNVVVESMLAGTPVVATAVGGVPEIVADGQTGLLIPPADPEAMAGAIERVLRMDREAKAAMTRAAREHARRYFTAEAEARQIERVYGDLLGRADTAVATA